MNEIDINNQLNKSINYKESKLSNRSLYNKTSIKERNELVEEYESEISSLNNKISELKSSLELLTNSNNNDSQKNQLNRGATEVGENNMWISEKYFKNWGIREAIREFIQNQYDGIITKIKSRKNLEVKKVGKEYIINGRKKYLEYDFLNKEQDKIFGKIRYNPFKNVLSISNEGELLLADFLLGGSKEEENNPDIIGVFGEGMKLAILSLCRLEKEVIIISSNKKYTFRLKEDINFIKNSIPQKCLHCKTEEYYDNDCKDQIKVMIKNITSEEWSNQIDNFLWLLGKNIEIYTSLDKNNKELGQVIYEDYLKSKIFVKGIFVQEIKEDKEKVVPGFNTSLKIDRDRNCIQDSYELKSIISEIMSGIINKNIDYLKSVQQKTGGTFIKTEYGLEKTDEEDNLCFFQSELKNLTNNLISCLESNNLNNVFSSYKLSNYLSEEAIKIIWNEMNLKPENTNKQPTDEPYSIKKFIEEKKLPEDFYPYYNVNYDLMKILEKSTFYKTIKTKFIECAEKAENVEPRKEYQIAIKDVCSKIQIFDKDFNETKIKFKKFREIDVDLCFKNNDEIIFSSLKLEEKLNEEWKFWIFVKILNIIGKKIEDCYSLFKKVFFI